MYGDFEASVGLASYAASKHRNGRPTKITFFVKGAYMAWAKKGLWTLQFGAQTLSPECLFLCSIWVDVKIMVPFWVPIIVRHLTFRVPKREHILKTAHIALGLKWHLAWALGTCIRV